jgi:hypothetical protein
VEECEESGGGVALPPTPPNTPTPGRSRRDLGKLLHVVRKRHKSSCTCPQVLIMLALCAPVAADDAVTVFLLDEKYEPVVRLEKLAPLSDAMRALLAMYALENGGGCESETEQDKGLHCELTAALGIGPQCSQAQVHLVRAWFNTIPAMGVHDPAQYAKVQAPGALEDVCYASSNTDDFQRQWDRIRVKRDGAEVSVDAVGSWHVRDQTGQFHYRTTYRIDAHTITTLSHTEIPVHHSPPAQ